MKNQVDILDISVCDNIKELLIHALQEFDSLRELRLRHELEGIKEKLIPALSQHTDLRKLQLDVSRGGYGNDNCPALKQLVLLLKTNTQSLRKLLSEGLLVLLIKRA